MRFIKFILPVLLLCIVADGYGQLTLTRREVYNYNVGDQFFVKKTSEAFAWHPWDPPRPYSYEKTSILGKAWSAANDTVKYNCLVETNDVTYHLVPSGSTYTMQPDTTYSQHTALKAYTDLDSLISYNPYPKGYVPLSNPCYTDSIDTVFYAQPYCMRKTWHKEYTNGGNCFEPADPDYDFVEGCGGPYFIKYYDYSQGAAMHQVLVYFVKGATTSCGTSIVMGVEKLELNSSLSVYPNPVHNILAFNAASAVTGVSIYSSLGELVLHAPSPAHSINLSGLQPGVYFACFSSGNQQAVRKLIKD